MGLKLTFCFIHSCYRFLALKVIYQDTGIPTDLSPSALVDLVWHTHISNPGHYLDTCNKLGVKIIDHDPEAARHQDSVRKGRLDKTKILYELVYNQKAPEEYWGLTLFGCIRLHCRPRQ